MAASGDWDRVQEDEGSSKSRQSVRGLLLVDGNEPKPETKANPNLKSAKSPSMNDVVEVPQLAVANINIFEFGSVAASADKVTLTKHPIFKDLEP
ncbi:hypothetical protein TB2_034047 [Malus domestica]